MQTNKNNNNCLTGILISINVMVWFILIETDIAIKPAISICGFLDKSNLTSELFSGRHSAKAMAAIIFFFGKLI